MVEDFSEVVVLKKNMLKELKRESKNLISSYNPRLTFLKKCKLRNSQFSPRYHQDTMLEKTKQK